MGQLYSRSRWTARRALSLISVLSLVAVLLISVPGTAFAGAPTVNLDADNSWGSSPNFATTFTEDGTPVNITDSDVATVADGATLASATITITNLLDAGAEVLAATPSGGIAQGDIVYAAPILTIAPAAPAPLADFEAVLASATYENTSQDPTEAPARTVTFAVNDGTADSATAISTVTAVAQNDAPTDITLTPSSVDENVTVGATVGTLATDDADSADTHTYEFRSPPLDNDLFTIVGDEIRTDALLDFEALGSPLQIKVRTTDSGTPNETLDKVIEITLTNINDNAPSVISNGGGPAASVAVAENTTAVTNVDATDADGSTEGGGGLAYTLSGTDDTLFTIDADGTLVFGAGPDFETPLDVGADNFYEVTVSVSDGVFTDPQVITVEVIDANEAPTVDLDADDSGGNSPDFAANFTEDGSAVNITDDDVDVADVDLDGTTLESATATVTNAQDGTAEQLSVDTSVACAPLTVNGDGTAALTITGTAAHATYEECLSTATYENTSQDPTEAPARTVDFVVNDGTADSGAATATVTVTSANDDPTITDISDPAAIPEDGATPALAYTVSDTEDPADALVVTATSSNDTLVPNDVANITIVGPDGGGDGTITITPAPNQFGTTTITVTVTDLEAGTAVDSFEVTVTSANDDPVWTSSATSSIPENTTTVITLEATDVDLPPDTIIFAVTGGVDSAFFDIFDGDLVFVAASDYEAFADDDGDNDYLVEVTASDGTAGVVQVHTVTVTDVNDAPTITSDGGGAIAAVSALENTTAVTNVNATDPDGDTEGGGGLTYALSGADESWFTIDADGVLTFVAAPDFETKLDTDADNDYEVTVTVTDSGEPGLTDDQDITVTVTDVVELSVVSFSAAASATVNEAAAPHSVELTLVTDGGADLGSDITVTVSDLGGTATSGNDYTAFPATQVTFPATSPDGTAMTVDLPVLDDLLAEGHQTVILSVAPISGPVTIGANPTHTATITDDEVATVEFEVAGSSVLEAPGAAMVDVVLRVSGPGGPGSIEAPVSVGVTNTDGTATFPMDYTLDTASLTWLAGSFNADVRQVPLTLENADLLEPDQGFTLGLDAPTGPASLGAAASHTLTIVDNVGPVLATVPGASVVEGTPLAVSIPFSDSNLPGDSHVAVVDWGDGFAAAAVVGNGVVGGSHTYADNGSFAVGVAIADSLLVPAATAIPITVTNDAPDFSSFGIFDATGSPKFEFKVGEVVAFNGSFVDTGLADTHTVVVDWGDGTTTSSAVPPGMRTFSIGHAYAGTPPSSDRFTARVDIRDDDGGTDALSGPVFVGSRLDAETVGLVNTAAGQWHLVLPDGGQSSFSFGNPGDTPLVGDWDCDGVDTPGQYRQSNGLAYVRNANSQGNASARYIFGIPGDMPLAGDFNGDGCDTISIYRPSEQRVYIINRLGANDAALGPADTSYVFGVPGDKPFVGDFNGDGIDTIGLHREATGLVYFRNSHTTGVADGELVFGDPGDRLVAADWTGDGTDTPGLFRPALARFYLRFTNTTGNADADFLLGEGAWLPIAGSFS